MKGNIKINDKIYKMADKQLSTDSLNSYQKENIKTYLACSLDISANKKISIKVKALDFNLEDSFIYNYIPEAAQNAPISKENIIKQFSKTQNTCFEFSKIDIFMDDNLFIPTSILNDIRREAIANIEERIIQSLKKPKKRTDPKLTPKKEPTPNWGQKKNRPQIGILLNVLDTSYDYSKLEPVDKIYIPLKYFSDNSLEKSINTLSTKGKIYIYLPAITKESFISTTIKLLENAFKRYNIAGIVVSNLSQLNIIESTLSKLKDNLDLVANYTFNVFNQSTFNYLSDLGFDTITLSPELDSDKMSAFSQNAEVIVYGNIPLMNASYCLLGKSNKCYKECKTLYKANQKFYLNDRYNFRFRIIPDNLQTITTIYNSRTTKLDISKLQQIPNYRYDFLNETIEEINSLLHEREL